MVGSSAPGVTALDLALSVVILFLLVAITVRTLWLLEERSDWRVLRRRRPPAEPEPPKNEAAPPPDSVPGREPALAGTKDER
jgi:hypothetical protein